MQTQEVSVQQFARLAHHDSVALSSDREPESRSHGSAPADERHRLVAAARLAILELESNARPEDDSRRFFAKPGEAEWRC